MAATAEQIVYRTVEALEAAGVPYMVVGSFSSNLYGLARSTRDADFVVELGDKPPTEIAGRLGADFLLDPQMSFETITRTYRSSPRTGRPRSRSSSSCWATTRTTGSGSPAAGASRWVSGRRTSRRRRTSS